jgi:hypothetical protein
VGREQCDPEDWEQTAGIHLAPYNASDSTAKPSPGLFFSRFGGSWLTGDVVGLVSLAIVPE